VLDSPLLLLLNNQQQQQQLCSGCSILAPCSSACLNRLHQPLPKEDQSVYQLCHSSPQQLLMDLLPVSPLTAGLTTWGGLAASPSHHSSTSRWPSVQISSVSLKLARCSGVVRSAAVLAAGQRPLLRGQPCKAPLATGGDPALQGMLSFLHCLTQSSVLAWHQEAQQLLHSYIVLHNLQYLHGTKKHSSCVGKLHVECGSDIAQKVSCQGQVRWPAMLTAPSQASANLFQLLQDAWQL
jgi:hypothetical protein